ncbi:MAG: hypothetical protein ABSA66_20275 [Roseiarcus sp.]|jgi:hypothetical protein
MLVETLRADWTARRANARVSALPEFASGSLTLGAGTKIAEPRGVSRDEAAEGERAVALVSTAIGRPLDASAAAHVRRALAKAREGDAPLALTHLALAGAGRLTEPCEDARRLFMADGLMKAGVPPCAILEALRDKPLTPADLDRAYNPDQPRVPAGNGIISGRWTGGDWQAEASASPQAKNPRVQLADASTTQGQEVRSDASPASSAPSAPEQPSATQSLLASFWNAVPGTHYSALAVQAWHRGDYVQFGLYEAAATLEAGLLVVPGAGAADETAAETLTLAERRAIQLAANKLAGQAFENEVEQGIERSGSELAAEVTAQTSSGVKTRLDFMTRDPTTGTIGCIECKASATAPLTDNQELAFPEIEQSGATIVGAGKPGFPGGMKIPPTTVQVIRGPK